MNNHICRAKDIYTGEWVYGYYVVAPEEYGHGELAHAIFNPNECKHICGGEYSDYGWREVNPDTVCRCTDMRDKNGTPIYENDCIGNIYNVVEYSNDGFCVAGDRPLSWFTKYWEIVGNVFDNKEK